MQTTYFSKRSFYTLFSLTCLSFSTLAAQPSYQNSSNIPQSSPHQNSSSYPKNYYPNTPATNQVNGLGGREEIAYQEESNYHTNRNHFTGDWSYKESWRNNKEAFFNGETQNQAYRESHPYGSAGIGYDAGYEKPRSHTSYGNGYNYAGSPKEEGYNQRNKNSDYYNSQSYYNNQFSDNPQRYRSNDNN